MATLQELLIKIGVDMGDVERKMTQAASTVEQNFKKVGDEVIKAGQKIEQVGGKIKDTGKGLSKNVTVPLVAIGGAAFKTASDFESSMTKITALVGIPREQVQAWEGDVRNLAKTYGVSGSEAADALFFITSAGLRGDDAMKALEASLKASAVGLGNVTTVADLATSAMNAYGIDTLDASQATDVLAAAVREGKLEAGELSGAMGQTLPIASAMGVQFHEVGAAFAAMSRTGTDASTGATQLRGILASLLKPTTQAEQALEEMGLSSAGLRRQIREEGLLATLETLNTAFDGNEEATAAVFGNVRALSGVMDMMGSNVDSTREIFDNMTQSTGMLDNAFEVTASTAEFQMRQAMAEVKDLLLDVGQTVLPIVVEAVGHAAEFVRNLADRWRELSPETQQFIVQAAMVAAAVGPVLIVVGTLISTLGKLVQGFGHVIKIFGLLSKVFMANPWAIVIAAVIALVVLIVKNWDTIKETISKAWDAIKDATEAVWNFIKDVISTAIDFITKFFMPFAIVRLIIENWDTIKEKTGEAWEAVKRIVSNAVEAVKNFVSEAWNTIKNTVSGALDAVKNTISEGWNAVKNVTTNVWNNIVAFVRNLPANIINAMKSLIQRQQQFFKQVWDGAKRAVTTGINNVLSLIRQLPSKIIGAIPNPWNLLVNIGKAIIQGLINGIQSMFGAIGSVVSGIGGFIKNLKGPEREDRKMLIPEGQAIMFGLTRGIEDGLPKLRSLLGDVTRDINTGFDVSIAAPRVAVPPAREQRIIWDVTGADEDMKRMIRRMARASGLEITEAA